MNFHDERQPTAPTSAWFDYVVPWLRWQIGGSPDDVALIVLSLGAVRP